ncbi:MAG: hypothetical protein KC620_23485 [Myxococcales bacterium]|nr:hypothetical protein [Myxococcales bacterium]
MDDNDPIVVLNRAATAPEGGWHVFPMQAGSVLIWVVKRFLWSLLLTVLVALGVVALEFVAIDDPRLPLMLLGALGVWVLLLCSGPLRVLFGGRHNLLVITPELVVWRLGSHVVSLPLAEVKAIREHMTTGRGYSYSFF